MVDSTSGGAVAAATAGVGGAESAAHNTTTVVPPLAREASAAPSQLSATVARLETLFRACGDALAASSQPSASDRGGGGPAGAPPPAQQVSDALATLAAAAAQCDGEVGQQLVVLRRGVAALAQEVSALADRYPALNVKSNWTGVCGTPSPPPTGAPRTPQVPASAPAALATSGAGGTSPSGGPAHQPFPLPILPSPTATSTPTPQQSPAIAIGSGVGLRSPGLAASSAGSSLARSAPLSAAARAVGAASPPLHAAVSPGRGGPLARSPASPPLGFSLADRPAQQAPAALLPRAACVEAVKTHLGHCVEWPPRPRGPRRVRPQPARRSASRAWGSAATSGGTGVDGAPPAATRSPAGDGTQRRRSETDEFLRRLTEESPYDLSMLHSPAYHPRSSSPAPSSIRSGYNSNSGSCHSGDDFDLRFEEEEQQQHHQRRLSASATVGRRASSKAVASAVSSKRHRSSHGAVYTTHTRHTPRPRTHSVTSGNATPPPPSKPAVPPRRGRPTLQESVDALVLAQLRADGVLLPASMVAELGWCDDAGDDADAAAGATMAAQSPGQSSTAVRRPSDRAASKGRRSAADKEEVDFAVVLQEVRAMVRCGRPPPVNGSGAEPVQTPTAAGSCRRQELSRASARLSALLPTTSVWLAQIQDFCVLLDDTAVAAATAAAASSDMDGARAAEEDRQAKRRGGPARQSPTPATSLTRERVSPAATASSTSSSATSSTAPSSDTAAAASPSDFSAVADELFSSAEEAEDSDDGVVATATAAPAALRGVPESLGASLEHSLSVVQDSCHRSHSSSSAVPSSLRDTSRSFEPPRDETGKERCELPARHHGVCDPRASAAALADVWLGGADAMHRGGGSVPPAAVSTSSASSPAQRHLPARHQQQQQQQQQQQHVLTPGARALAERRRRTHEAQQQRQQTLQQRHDALLRRRCVRARADTPEPHGRRSSSAISGAGTAAADGASPPASWAPGLAGGRVTPVLDHMAAAEHLRALCGLLQTDLIVIGTLQELSTLLSTTDTTRIDTAVPVPDAAKAVAGGPITAATRLLLALQQHRKMQSRASQEAAAVRLAGGGDAVAAVALTSLSEPPPVPGHNDDGGVAPLMISVLHPISAVGYTPMLSRATSPAGSTEGLEARANGVVSHEQQQLTRYLVAVAPYLLAWQSTTADVRGCVGSGVANGAAASPAPAHPAVSDPTLPLPVWVYVESLTTALLEEARKLNAMYELYVLLVAEATLQGRGADAAHRTGEACGVAPVASTAFTVAPLWHGGTDETLMAYVRRRGRAAALAQAAGVAGTATLLENGLEKFVAPVSAHLLSSFDQLEGRQLLHSVFQEVQLSDVVARAKARREQQQQQQQQRLLRDSSSPDGRLRSPGAPGMGDDDALHGFTLPPGALSAPALRSAANARWSMREAERSTSPGRGGGSAEEHDDDPAAESPSQRRSGNTTNNSADGDTTPQRRGRPTPRRIITLSGSGETRHAIIEGFVRYLTGGDRRRGSTVSAESNSPSHGADRGSTATGGSSPSHQRASSHAATHHHHHHSGLTIDVPHTSALLHEVDTRLEAGASNTSLIRAVERLLRGGSLVDALSAGKALPQGGQSELSTRRLFSTHAAAFTTRHTLPSYSAACVSVVQCRWQPAFQSTMCFCPVTRRRCLDPLVCGALLICATLPPQEVFYSAPDPSQSSTPTHGVSRGPAEVVVASAIAAAAAAAAAGGSRQFPNTIRALRSRFERTTEASGSSPPSSSPPPPQQQQQQQAPSPRSGPSQPQPPAGVFGVADARAGQPWLSVPHRGSLPPPIISSAASSLLPAFLLRGPSMVPDAMMVPRIMTRAATALYADSAMLAGDGDDEGRSGGDTRTATTTTTAVSSALTDDAFRALRAVTVPLETPPVTRNLLASPDRAQAAFLNPPTLLECGHVVSHKTYLDLRTTARRSNRHASAAAAAAGGTTTTVVCCPYCSKVTAVTDAVTLSYLY
ncbi:hypothetical protein NESM_000180600 [Novymonas esmeraldas]|uniref:Uncharacterized protein n=1 Tax=Novymonas esmeraldas TaxID=1808958 RepID=A0AAW0F748_9TRYP